MIKYISATIVFAEFPDEICLALNITNCPHNCLGCSTPELQQDIGIELTEEELDQLLIKYKGVTMVGFMGGDRDIDSIIRLTEYIRQHYKKLLVGMYSGHDSLDMRLLNTLDYYKIGRFKMFTEEEETWKNQTAGPIVLPTSNQLMFKLVNGKWVNITEKFRTKKINDWKKTIL